MASNSFSVNVPKMIQAEQQLRDLNRRFNTETTHLRDAEAALNRSWDGEANDVFHNEFINKSAKSMDEFKSLVDKFCEALHDIHKNYDSAERVNQIVAKLDQ